MMLQLTDVRKAFIEPDGTPLPILEIPQFAADRDEQLAIIGESGCGKTTLLHIIAGIARPDHGLVEIDGINIAKLAEAGRDRFRAQKIGFIFQTFNLLPGFTALENVLLGMTFGGKDVDKGRAHSLLQRVGLAHRTHHKPAAMSVGEQQRVAVARALANRPRLLLADEPTANVDHAHQQQIVNLIRQTCREEGVTLLIVTHAREVADGFERVERLEEVNRVVGQSAASNVG